MSQPQPSRPWWGGAGLTKTACIYNSKKYNAFWGHGYNNFRIEIGEYFDRYSVKVEQDYLDIFKQEYTIFTK